jgi:zinc transport system permease protein
MYEFFQLFSYGFVIRAFIIGILVSVCASLLGVTLVLKRYSMIGDGLSHVGFGAISVALALNIAPIYVAVPVMFISALLLLRLKENSKINTDAAIGVISSGAIAVGVISASLSGGMNVDVYGYMFGSILALTTLDVVLSIVLSFFVIAVYALLYNKIFAVTFDEEFARSAGIKTRAFNILFSMLTAFTVIVGMRLMGTMLISGLIIFPAITAMGLFSSYKKVTVGACVISLLSFVCGMILSCIFAYIPVGAGVVVVNLVVLLITRFFKGFVLKR